jgi:hypothetical protein
MIETLRNFTQDEIWALHRAISGEVTRLALLNESMTDEDKHLQATLVGLVPEIEHAWQIMKAMQQEREQAS